MASLDIDGNGNIYKCTSLDGALTRSKIPRWNESSYAPKNVNRWCVERPSPAVQPPNLPLKKNSPLTSVPASTSTSSPPPHQQPKIPNLKAKPTNITTN